MAHELSHVLLRHGTANASKAQNPWLQLGQIAGAVGGAVVGGAAGVGHRAGQRVRPRHAAAEVQPRLREAGRPPGCADHGARRVRSARPRAHVRDDRSASRRAAEPAVDEQPSQSRQSHGVHHEGSRAALTIAARGGHERVRADQGALRRARRRRRRSAELAQAPSEAGRQRRASVGTPGQPVPRALARSTESISGGGIFQASVPSNWTSVSSASRSRWCPQNGYGELNGQTVFTHGVEFGIAKAASRDLREATNTWLEAVAQGNPSCSSRANSRSCKMSQRTALGDAARPIRRRSAARERISSTRRSSPTVISSTT